MRRILLYSLALVIGCILLPSRPAKASEHLVLRARVVEEPAFPSVESGIIVTWVSIAVVRDGDLKRLELLQVYVSPDEPVPRFGEHCIFRVHNERAGGFVGRSTVDTHDAIIVDDFRCGERGKYQSEILTW